MKKKGNINNTNSETESQNYLPVMGNIEQISDTELINRTVNKILNIRLDI